MLGDSVDNVLHNVADCIGRLKAISENKSQDVLIKTAKADKLLEKAEVDNREAERATALARKFEEFIQ